MRILLTGRSGQVGWELERALPALGEVIATDRKTLDLADPDALRRVVRDARPDVIVNAAAYTAVDKAESEHDLCMQINGIAPGVLADETKRLGAILVHYSTDYVFDGTNTTPYGEKDRPNPLNVYGKTKLEGEQRVRAAGCRHLIVRTSWVYGPRGKNFYRSIVAKAAAGDKLRVVDDQTGVPTTSAFIATGTVELLSTNADGVLHLVPSGHTTWYGFAREILDQLGMHVPLERIRTGDWPTPARRPSFSVLDNSKAAALLGRQLAEWQEVLARCVVR